MLRIIESLVPADRRIYWRRVGGMFSLYVAIMITAATMLISHESSRNIAHDRAATVAAERSVAPSHQASVPVRQMARYD
jgi:hypothetical protein